MNPPRFPSKRDPWLVAVLVLSALACVLAVPAAVEGGSGVTMLAPLPVLLLGAGLPLWVLFATHYRFDADSLCVRCGPFSWRVPLQEVRAVTSTRSALSGPALSLDRLRIDYGGRTLLVSPADREGFLVELRLRAPEASILMHTNRQ